MKFQITLYLAVILSLFLFSLFSSISFLCAFDYHHGTFFGRLRRRKLSKNILSFFIELRWHYPAEQRMYIIMDNLSAHWTPDIARWARGNRVSLVPTLTNTSWLNPIETHLKS